MPSTGVYMEEFNAIGRICKILEILPCSRGHQGISISALHHRLRRDGFDVCKRTLQRDLSDLSKVFPVECVGADGQAGLWKSARRLDIGPFLRPLREPESWLDGADQVESDLADYGCTVDVPDWPSDIHCNFEG